MNNLSKRGDYGFPVHLFNEITGKVYIGVVRNRKICGTTCIPLIKSLEFLIPSDDDSEFEDELI